MKKFSDIPSVVHAFAWQTYPECATYNGNVFYREGVIYSYGHHFPMGRLLEDRVVLLTTLDYSQSTGNHKRKLLYAVNHMDRHYCINPENPLGRDAVFETMVQIEGLLRQAAKRRVVNLREADIYSAQAMFDEIEWIRAWAKKNAKKTDTWTGWRSWSYLPDQLKAKWLKTKKLLAAAKDDVNAVILTMNEGQKAAARKRYKDQKAAMKQAAEQAVKALDHWLDTGERISGFHQIKNTLGIDGLRSFEVSGMVQTTQGLNVPAEDCRKVWPLVKSAYSRRDKEGLDVIMFSDKVRASNRLGTFAPTGINEKGHLVVGCHNFTRELVERLAKDLGLC